MIHKEGTASIILALILGAGLIVLFNWLTPMFPFIGWVLAAVLLIIILQFFRNPKRNIDR